MAGVVRWLYRNSTAIIVALPLVVLGSFTLALMIPPNNVFVRAPAVVALFMLVGGGPLATGLWVVGRRSHGVHPIRDRVAEFVTVALCFLSAASIAVLVLVPMSD